MAILVIPNQDDRVFRKVNNAICKLGLILVQEPNGDDLLQVKGCKAWKIPEKGMYTYFYVCVRTIFGLRKYYLRTHVF